MMGKDKKENLVSVIKYEGNNDTLIWKHPEEDFNMGSQLIVHESQEAVFFRDGQALDLFGPGRYTLETGKLPVLKEKYKLPADVNQVFHSEVYFINKTIQMGMKWGTPDKVRFIDPLTGVPLELGASGEMNIQVADSRKMLVKLVGTMGGISWEDRQESADTKNHAGFTKSLQKSFRPMIANAVKTNLPEIIKSKELDILELDENLDEISSNLREKILPTFSEYGLAVPQFYVTNIVLPEEDDNFRQIRELHTLTLQTKKAQMMATVKTAEAQAEAAYRTAQEQSAAAIEQAHRQAEMERQTTATEVAKREAEREIIQSQADRVKGLNEAEVMQAKGYNQKDVLQAEVQKAYAEGIGKMGPDVVSGGSGSPGIASEMLSLGVGMAAANAISPQLGAVMQGVNPNNTTQGNTTGAATWDCHCGQRGIVGNFCSNCGSRKPEPAGNSALTWDCNCGQKRNTGNYCSNCGTKKGE